MSETERPGPRTAWRGPSPQRIVLATANPGKTAELSQLLAGRVAVVPRPAGIVDVREDALTLEGNARRKAHAILEATGDAALADDTGLEVDALHGEPGVRSARYAGEPANDQANIDKLLAALAHQPGVPRTARFRTVLVLMTPDGRELVAEGIAEGMIATTPQGDAGFGYDPVFLPRDGDGRTFAQMPRDEKSAMSHRGRALQELLRVLDETNPN